MRIPSIEGRACSSMTAWFGMSTSPSAVGESGGGEQKERPRCFQVVSVFVDVAFASACIGRVHDVLRPELIAPCAAEPQLFVPRFANLFTPVAPCHACSGLWSRSALTRSMRCGKPGS